jgi:hypothetical protein
LEGLEISEVLLSNLEYSGRLDAEYYRPEFLKNEHLLRARNSKQLSSLSDFLIGPFGSAFTVENYTEDKSYRYIRGKDVKQMSLMDNPRWPLQNPPPLATQNPPGRTGRL